VVFEEETMRTRYVTALVTGGFATIAFACSLSSSPPPDQSVSDFCADWAKAICQLSNGPCAFVETTCAAYQTTVCMQFVSSAQSGTREYSQSNGKACIDALNGAYGNSPSSISASTLLAVNATCSKVVIGNQAVNQPCTGDNDCTGSLVCVPVVGQSGSVCASAVTPKDAGDFCADPGDECQGDSYCAAQASGLPKCVPTPATNGPCSAAMPCGSADHCANGTCQARGGSGAPCTSNDDCSTSAAYCDTYPPAACTNGLTFARGSIDCNGIAGLDQSGGSTTSPGGGLSDAPSGG
jgi:hypothetical protein